MHVCGHGYGFSHFTAVAVCSTDAGSLEHRTHPLEVGLQRPLSGRQHGHLGLRARPGMVERTTGEGTMSALTTEKAAQVRNR